MFNQLNPLLVFIALIFGGALFALGYFVRKLATDKALEGARQSAIKILEDAKKESENKRREGEIEAKDLKFHIHAPL